MTGIGQLQTLAHLFQPDAASTLVCHAFGMIAVGYFAMYLSGAFTEVDTDKAGLGGGDAMLEGILYEGNKDTLPSSSVRAFILNICPKAGLE